MYIARLYEHALYGCSLRFPSIFESSCHRLFSVFYFLSSAHALDIQLMIHPSRSFPPFILQSSILVRGRSWSLCAIYLQNVVHLLVLQAGFMLEGAW